MFKWGEKEWTYLNIFKNHPVSYGKYMSMIRISQAIMYRSIMFTKYFTENQGGLRMLIHFGTILLWEVLQCQSEKDQEK
jgi:hypothetical protein